MLVGYEVKNIKDLNISLDSLYKEEKQINIHLSDKPFIFNVVLNDRKGINCKISSFGANLYAVTNKGMNYEKYNSIGTLQTALKKLIKNKVNTNGEITFSLNNEVFSF